MGQSSKFKGRPVYGQVRLRPGKRLATKIGRLFPDAIVQEDTVQMSVDDYVKASRVLVDAKPSPRSQGTGIRIYRLFFGDDFDKPTSLLIKSKEKNLDLK